MAKPLTRYRPSSGTLCRSLAIQPYLLMHTIIFETLYMAAFQVFLSHSIPSPMSMSMSQGFEYSRPVRVRVRERHLSCDIHFDTLTLF